MDFKLEVLEESKVEEVITESAPVEKETSTQINDAIKSEKVEENVPLSRLNKEVYKKHEALRGSAAKDKTIAELKEKLTFQNSESIKRPSPIYIL